MKVQEITVPKVSMKKSAEGFQRRKYPCTPGEQKNQHREEATVQLSLKGQDRTAEGWDGTGGGGGYFKGRRNNVPKDPTLENVH